MIPNRVPMFRCTIYGLPVAQARRGTRIVRARSGKVFAQSYDPLTSRSWKETVKVQILAALPPDWKLLEGPLAVTLFFRMPRPQSAPKREVYPAKKPDLDNLVKGTTDAAEGVLYKRDAQIVAMEASKHYGDRPGVEIEIAECL